MINKIENIKNSKHPYSIEMNTTITRINELFNYVIAAINIIGAIIAVVGSSALADWADDHSGDVVDVPVNFFGYYIEMESDTFFGSPFMVFIHTGIVVVLITLALNYIKNVITMMLKTKELMLDSAYRSEKMTELMVLNSCDSKIKNSDTQQSLNNLMQ